MLCYTRIPTKKPEKRILNGIYRLVIPINYSSKSESHKAPKEISLFISWISLELNK